ncbi:transketolase [Candidatus Desulfovibrio trichonymphae]|uniref:Transketolase n=1 Tax=Candidatus Desulfovibrio trichonymphae TaxID=1725232 RepID=A0A1J1DYS3_9BACT|nr:transketolase [Candidatus Desulfovibrio trichonymphae]BAV92278.1 transketolase [Candidatus Desulfovibrio trichonymphae]
MPTRRECANAVRALAIDAIEKAGSGHPGAPLGMADMAEALWRHGFRHNPSNPAWPDRDRFVLSNGHASMLYYAVLHLTGYDISLADIKNFRQWGSKTPGHPENHVCPGVEMTTGPLGQGIASAVGMALAERMLAARFNTNEHCVVDHRTYVFCGDGCLMEGVSHEACSLAGIWGLGKLIVLYDSNGISIDGRIDDWYNEDVAARFIAYGWQVIGPVDGHDGAALDAALAAARAEIAHPSLVVCRTHIGFGSPKADSEKSHGAPLGAKAAQAARKTLNWTEPPFVVPETVYAAWNARAAGQEAEDRWNATFASYKKVFPESAAEFSRRMAGDLPTDWSAFMQNLLCEVLDEKENAATRAASQKVLEHLVPRMPELIGGSADLSGSVGTAVKASQRLNTATYKGNYLSYGVREFGMGTIMNGLALHGGFMPYAGTFMAFSDQAKNAVRLAALMGLRLVWVFTHDSIGVGEDGPTHQPVEQIAALRATPNLLLWRPCDSVETVAAWKCALASRHTPVCLSLSRQKLQFMPRDAAQLAVVAKGGYVLHDCEGAPEIILLATGSEVALAVETAERLAAPEEGSRRARVVSLPCAEIFDAQDDGYKESVLPDACRARIAVEAAAPDYWRKYVGLDGAVLGMATFGASAPASVLCERFGFTSDHLLNMAKALLSATDKKVHQ